MIQDKEYFRGNMYMIIGGYLLYLAYKLIREMDMVREKSPVLPWVFVFIFVIAGAGALYLGATTLKKHKKALQEAKEALTVPEATEDDTPEEEEEATR